MYCSEKTSLQPSQTYRTQLTCNCLLSLYHSQNDYWYFNRLPTSLSWNGLDLMVTLPKSMASWKRVGTRNACNFSYACLANLYPPRFFACFAMAYSVDTYMTYITCMVYISITLIITKNLSKTKS